MTVKTKGVWTATTLSEVKGTIASEVATLTAQGKTDGTYEFFLDVPEAGQNTTIRTWDTQQTAEQWLTFIYSLGVDPVSYAIVNE